MVQSDALFSNNGFDAIWAKLLLCCSAAFEVEAVKAGVGSVVAFHRREEAVQRRADVGIVKSWSDEITGISASSKAAAIRDCSVFQWEIVDFRHCLCELIRLNTGFKTVIEMK